MSEDGYRFVVQHAGDGLALVVPGQEPIELESVSATEWQAAPLAVRLSFEVEDGRVVLHQDAPYVQAVEARRVR